MKGLLSFVIGICLIVTVGVMLTSFEKDCQHIYTAIEPAEKLAYSISTGMEQKDIVCVKCFHVTKQQSFFTGAEDIGKMYVDSFPVRWGALIDSTGRKLKLDITGTSIKLIESKCQCCNK